MKSGKWIAVVVVVVLAALTSCRKTPFTSQNTVQQQPNAVHSEPKSVEQTSLARLEPKRTQSKDEQSCKVFVSKFYDWYVHGVWSDFCNDTHDIESCKKASEFGSVEEMSIKQVLSPKLNKLFDDDRAAEAAVNEDGVGFLEEGDYFINTNGGPSSYYEVENVRVKNGVCNADVYGESKEGIEEVKIMPELAKTGEKWVFVNFHYDYGDDLVSGLTGDLKSNREAIKHNK